MRHLRGRHLLYVLLAGFQVFQESVYLFGPVEWLQPIIMRSHSLWLLFADSVVDSLGVLLPVFHLRGMMLITHVIIAVGALGLLVWLDRLFGVKQTLLAIALSVPLFAIMPAPAPGVDVSTSPLAISWGIWSVCLGIATVAAFRGERRWRTLAFLVFLTVPYSVIGISLKGVEDEPRLPVGLGIGIVLMALYAVGLIRGRRRAGGRGAVGL